MSIGDYNFLTLKQAAELLNVSEQMLRDAIKNKKLMALELGNGYQFKKEWLDIWLESKIVNPELARAGGK